MKIGATGVADPGQSYAHGSVAPRWAPAVAAGLAAAMFAAGGSAWLAAPFGALAVGGLALWSRRSHRRRQADGAARLAALQRALARRDEHLAATVHELRTPLSSVTAALDLLRGDWVAPGRETGEVLDEATLAARHLGRVVDDLLDDAALNAGRLRLRVAAHRVGPLLDDAVRLLRLHAERRAVRLHVDTVDDALAVRADATRFCQVVCNLVGNAIKAAPADGTVRLTVRADARQVRFAVADDGPGVARELRQRLFDPFVTGAREPGTGLGLHVSRRLVRQMGGTIGHGEPARGAEFWFELPRATLPRRRSDVAPMAGAAR